MTTGPQSRTWWARRTAPQRPPKSAVEYLRREELGLTQHKPLWKRILTACFTHRAL